MRTQVKSKIGNFTINIESFWDYKSHAYKFRIMETHEVFPNQDKAIKRAKMILKNKRDQYCKKYNVVHRKRTKHKESENSESNANDNYWIQINITNDDL